MRSLIIGLTGLARSGKQEVADYLIEKYGFIQKDFVREIIFKECAKRGFELTKMNFSVVGDELRKTGGKGILAKMLLDELKKIKSDKLVITGFRSPEEVDIIRNEFLTFYLVEVQADPSVRFERRKEDDPQTEKEFFERDERDIKNKGLNKVLKMADFRIKNSGSVDALRKEIDKLMEKIGEEK